MTTCAFGQQLRHSPPCNAKRRDRHGTFDAEAERPRCVTAAQGVGESGQVPQQPQPRQIVFDAFAQLIIIIE